MNHRRRKAQRTLATWTCLASPESKLKALVLKPVSSVFSLSHKNWMKLIYRCCWFIASHALNKDNSNIASFHRFATYSLHKIQLKAKIKAKAKNKRKNKMYEEKIVKANRPKNWMASLLVKLDPRLRFHIVFLLCCLGNSTVWSSTPPYMSLFDQKTRCQSHDHEFFIIPFTFVDLLSRIDRLSNTLHQQFDWDGGFLAVFIRHRRKWDFIVCILFCIFTKPYELHQLRNHTWTQSQCLEKLE